MQNGKLLICKALRAERGESLSLMVRAVLFQLLFAFFFFFLNIHLVKFGYILTDFGPVHGFLCTHIP